jgi:hypothetical protein
MNDDPCSICLAFVTILLAAVTIVLIVVMSAKLAQADSHVSQACKVLHEHSLNSGGCK